MKEAATFLSWAVSCSQGRWSSVSGAQEPGWALSVVSETRALTYTLLIKLITFYLKLKFSNF